MYVLAWKYWTDKAVEFEDERAVRLWEEVFGVHEAIELTTEDMPLPPKAKV